MSDSWRPRGLYSPWNCLGQNTGVGSQPFPSPGDLPNPRIEPRSATLQVDSCTKLSHISVLISLTDNVTSALIKFDSINHKFLNKIVATLFSSSR